MKKALLTLLAMFLIATPSFALTTYKLPTKEIKNSKLDCTTFEKNNIEIVRNKYELQQKASDVAFGYEYIIINKNNTPITLKEMGALNVLGTMAMAKEMLKDVDATDFLTGYNVVRGVKTNNENSTFTTPFPFDYKIEPNGQIRVLVLSEMGKTPIAEFQFLVNDKTSIITFDENGYSSQKIANSREYYKSQIDSYNLFHNTGSLGVCISEGEAHLVNSYLKTGIDINQKFMGMYPTNYAVIHNQPEILKMLLEAGADANATFEGKSLLIYAIAKKSSKMTKLLIDHGANPNQKYMGQSLSLIAIQSNEPEILKQLLKAGADPNAEFGKTPLLVYAIIKKSPEMAKLLIDSGAKLNEYTGKRTFLNLAINLNQPKIVEYLVNAGANINEHTINFANKSKNEDIKKLVLSKSK